MKSTTLKQIALLTLLNISAITMGGCVNNKQASSENKTATKSNDLNFVLLDVRTDEEYTENGLPQATLIPHNQLGNYKQTLNRLTKGDKNMPIKVYCRSGRRAGVAITSLKSMGYTNLENLESRAKALDYINSSTP